MTIRNVQTTVNLKQTSCPIEKFLHDLITRIDLCDFQFFFYFLENDKEQTRTNQIYVI